MTPGLSRRGLLAALPLALLPLPATALPLPLPPLGRYVYDVEVSDRGRVGSLTIDLVRTGELLQVVVERHIQVKVLGITAYRNESTVLQRLEGGRLVYLQRETNDDGDRSSLSIRLEGDRLVAEAGGRSWTLDPGLLSTSPWCRAVVERGRLIDTDSGQAVEVATLAKGREEVPAAGRRLSATRYAQRGGVARDLWFGDEDRLVRMVTYRDDRTVTMSLRALPG